eukprot:14982611-Heterocapsa_arctica.AAC.1
MSIARANATLVYPGVFVAAKFSDSSLIFELLALVVFWLKSFEWFNAGLLSPAPESYLSGNHSPTASTGC